MTFAKAVFAGRVAHHLMMIGATDQPITGMLIRGDKGRMWGDKFMDEAVEGGGISALDDGRNGLSAAL